MNRKKFITILVIQATGVGSVIGTIVMCVMTVLEDHYDWRDEIKILLLYLLGWSSMRIASAIAKEEKRKIDGTEKEK